MNKTYNIVSKSTVLEQIRFFFLSTNISTEKQILKLRKTIIYILSSLLIAVPLTNSEFFYNQFISPKFVILLIGSMALLGVFTYFSICQASLKTLNNNHCYILSIYMAGIILSTVFAVNPAFALQGSFIRQLGLISYLCFCITFFAVIVAVEDERKHFEFLFKAFVLAGSLVALYGLGQIIGLISIPIGQATQTMIETQSKRVNSTLGHADFTGNFLLYVVYPIAILVITSKANKVKLLFSGVLISVVLSIIFTGTRGAWIGLIIGGLVFLFFTFSERKVLLAKIPKSTLRYITSIVISGIILLILFIGFTKWGMPIRSRLLAFSAEGYTGAGRTTLWKYTISLFPKYWLTGWGLDSFRFAELPYKTIEIAKLTSGFNQEDPHNIFLSSLVSTGLFTTVVYISLIFFALRYFLVAIYVASEKNDKWCSIGLLSSFSGVLVHGFFIYHDISTGLYFFFFLAISYCWYKVVTKEKVTEKPTKNIKTKPVESNKKNLSWLLAAILSIPLIGAIIYSSMLLVADYNIRLCSIAASVGDYNSTVDYGKRAVEMPLYQTDFYFLFATSLTQILNVNPNLDIKQVSKLAIDYAEKSTVHTAKAEASFILIASLNLSIGELKAAENALKKAEQADPQNPFVQLIWGSYFISVGDIDAAENALKKAELVKPRNPLIPTTRASGFIKKGELDKAFEQLMIAKSLSASNSSQKRLARDIVKQTYQSTGKENLREQVFDLYPKLREEFEQK